MSMETMYENNPKKRKFTCDLCTAFAVLDIPLYPTKELGWANIWVTQYVEETMHACVVCLAKITEMFPKFKARLDAERYAYEMELCCNMARDFEKSKEPDKRKFSLASRPRSVT